METNKGYAIVTGGSRGCGEAICYALAKDGYNIAVNYVSPSSKVKAEAVAEKIQTEYGQNACVVYGNVGIAEDCFNIVGQAVAALGEELAVLVNNAGIACGKQYLDTTLEDMQEIINVDLMGPLWLTKAALPYLQAQSGACVVNIASFAGVTAMGNVVYGAAKAGLVGCTRQMGQEFGQYGIRVNSICPGTIETDMISPQTNQENIEIIRQISPLKRIGAPADIADCVSYIVGAKFLTCENITVSGGVFAMQKKYNADGSSNLGAKRY